MKKVDENFDTTLPINQLKLYNLNTYFDFFVKLFKKNKLPNTILLTGPKGSGKATFAYHFINYLLSYNEDDSYSIKNYVINPNNKSYLNVSNNTHPNFFLLDNSEKKENIKVENVKRLLKFLNMSTYNSTIKIILIDDAEFLNINASNALLKSLEFPSKNTFFLINHDSKNKILNTIKSRCIEFKFFLNHKEKKNILNNIISEYNYNFNVEHVENELYYDTPGNILAYLKIFSENNLDISENKFLAIFNLLDLYKKKKDTQMLTLISLIIELFYNNLVFSFNKNSHIYFHNRLKILNKIKDFKKFNLDRSNLLFFIQGILKNEK